MLICIQAAGQSAKVEQTVFEALSEIPYAMGSARKYLDFYRDGGKEALEKMIFDLFRAVIGALTHIMQFFQDSTISMIRSSNRVPGGSVLTVCPNRKGV